MMFEEGEQELPGAQHQEAAEQRLGDRVQLALQTRFQVKKVPVMEKFYLKTCPSSDIFQVKAFQANFRLDQKLISKVERGAAGE